MRVGEVPLVVRGEAARVVDLDDTEAGIRDGNGEVRDGVGVVGCEEVVFGEVGCALCVVGRDHAADGSCAGQSLVRHFGLNSLWVG